MKERTRESKAKQSTRERQLTKFERGNRIGRERRLGFALDGEAETLFRVGGTGVFGSFEYEVL